jgi:eukaryotic-like serine/threonine-protein kinase
MIGEKISHYRIEEKLGEGGMGIVYKAHDTKLDRTVALKFLPQHAGVNESEKRRFFHEAQAASALEHSNICNIHSIEETEDGQIFIVMAYYDGMSLKEKIGQGPLPLQDVLSYAVQITSGLQKAHEKGVIHRDLKPANIFITNDDQVKIIDFGLAKATQRSMLTQSGTTLGTVPYMSPEQAQGNKVDYRTDIWSLGVVMYEMVTGRLPFTSEYDTALVYSILNEEPEPVTGLRSGVPMALEEIILKCLEKDPQNRYQHAEEIIVDLRRRQKEVTSGVRSKVFVNTGNDSTPGQSGYTTSSVSERQVKFGIKPWVYSIPVIILFLIALYIYLSEKSPAPLFDRSIAVLPFQNLSPNPDDAFFADGVHEDIIIQLSGIGNLRVIARSSVLAYRAEERNLQQIANNLEVSAILEGSVRRDGDRVRVAVQLVDPYGNQSLWAHSYERSMTGIFEIQQAIADEIASALRARLTPEERERLEQRPTGVTEAYEYYLRARDWRRLGLQEENFRTANSLLQRAIEYDPQFAHAYALLSQTYSALVWFGYDTSPQTIELSRRNAERALELRPDLAESYLAMGYHYYWCLREYEKALEHLNRAHHLQPNNADIYGAISFVERRLGKFERSVETIKKAISLDPINDRLHSTLAELYLVLRRYEEAHAVIERQLTLTPDDSYLRVLYSINHISWKGEDIFVKENINEYPQMKRDYPFHSLNLQFQVRDFRGMISSVDDISERIYQTWIGIRPSSYFLGLAYAYLNEGEKAKQYYEEALSTMKELYADFPDDPRYRMGLGKIFAGIGMHEEAIEEGRRAVELMPTSFDAYWGPMYEEELAQIYAQLNRPKEAVEILRRLLTIPSYVSTPRLRLDPSWDPIRQTPEFQKLMMEYEDPAVAGGVDYDR